MISQEQADHLREREERKDYKHKREQEEDMLDEEDLLELPATIYNKLHR